jgi:hypothetical protein
MITTLGVKYINAQNIPYKGFTGKHAQRVSESPKDLFDLGLLIL